MSTEPQAPPPPQPETPLLERLGTSGKMLGAGAIVGIIALFLPFVSVSVKMEGAANPLGGAGLNISNSANAMGSWQGVVSLLAYVAAIGCSLMLYPIRSPEQKNMGWSGLGAGAVAAILALWMLIDASRAGSSTNLGGMGQVSASAGIGAYLNLIAAGVVAYGGFLKAKEERLL